MTGPETVLVIGAATVAIVTLTLWLVAEGLRRGDRPARPPQRVEEAVGSMSRLLQSGGSWRSRRLRRAGVVAARAAPLGLVGVTAAPAAAVTTYSVTATAYVKRCRASTTSRRPIPVYEKSGTSS